MSMNAHPHSVLPPPVAAALSQMLAQWADRHALRPVQAEAIRRAILEVPREKGPPAFEYEWWQEFFELITGVVTHATAPALAVAAAVSTMPELAGAGALWPHRRWPQPGGTGGTGYLPYLRLT